MVLTPLPSTSGLKRSALSTVRTSIKKANAAIDAKAPEAAEAVKVAVSKIDQAAGKGILHKNNAARKKSALVSKLNANA